MPEESLITPAIQALIGVHTPRGRVRINRQLVSRAMETMQDGGLPLPAEGEVVPGYVLLAGGGGDEPSGSPSFFATTLMVSSEWRFERPLRMGDEFEVTSGLASVSERLGGRFGHAVYLRNEVHYRDAAGNLAAVTAMTMMQYDARNAPGAGDD